MPAIAVPLIVTDSLVLLALVCAVFGAGFVTGLYSLRRKDRRLWNERMRRHGYI
jgi:hypothetical protein